MLTRATIGEVRVTIGSTRETPPFWFWVSDTEPAQHATNFRTLALAYADVQATFGESARICRHSEGAG